MPFGENDFITQWNPIQTNTTNTNHNATTTFNNYWTAAPQYDWVVNADTGTITGTINTEQDYVTSEDLDKFIRRMYKIIEEHTKIDITEDEFIKLLNEGE